MKLILESLKNAINPQTKCFRDFPEWAVSWASDKVNQDPIIAMYCTGGIRCENLQLL